MNFVLDRRIASIKCTTAWHISSQSQIQQVRTLPATTVVSSWKQNTADQIRIMDFVLKKLPNTRKKSIDEALLSLFTLDFQPFSVVENQGFRKFVRELNASYQIRSRKHISKSLVPAKYKRCMLEAKRIASSIKKCCITTDCWTSWNPCYYSTLYQLRIHPSIYIIRWCYSHGQTTAENLGN